MRNILWLIAVICILMWIFGLMGLGVGMASGNLLHVLLVIAIIAILYNIIAGRRNP